MTNLPMFPEHDSGSDDTPFPLLVAKHFNFPLAYHERGDEIYYAIQDWIRGLTGKRDVSSLFSSMQRSIEEISTRTLLLPYKSADRKMHKRKFTTDANLILIMNTLRTLHNRPNISEARQLFAKYLAFKPTSSYKPTKTLFEYNVDQLDLDIEDWESDDFLYYRISNEEYAFYDRYFRSQFYRRHLLDNFIGRTKDKIKPHYYDLITNDIYKGLWKRKPETLKIQMGANSLYAVRMLMPGLGFMYHQLVSSHTTQKLSGREDLWWYEIRYTVKIIAARLGVFAKEMSEYLRQDIATGRPLLAQG